jgi:hypothetical protein
MTVQQMIDVHAHVYPAGCFTEVIKTRADFKLVDNPRGQSLLYRGSHVMSMPMDQDNLPKRLASMDEAGIATAILSVGTLNIGWAGSGDAAAAHFVGLPRVAGNIQVVFDLSLCCRARSRTRCCKSWIALSVWALPA